jgi:hypothetical protein
MSVPKTFTPALIAHLRQRYEETDEPVTALAAELGISPRTFRKHLERWGWTKRRDRPPRDLSPAQRLLLAAKAAGAAPSADSVGLGTVACEAAAPAGRDDPQQPLADLIARLQRAVEVELATVERLRAHLGTQAQAPVDAERTARTLETLARTLKEVERLRSLNAVPADREDDDDLPRDLDEFRRVLARRIDAFVASRLDAGLPGQRPAAEGGGQASCARLRHPGAAASGSAAAGE